MLWEAEGNIASENLIDVLRTQRRGALKHYCKLQYVLEDVTLPVWMLRVSGCCYCEKEKGKMTFIRRWNSTACGISAVAKEQHYQILIQLSYEEKFQILVSIEKNLKLGPSLGWIVKTKAKC